MQAAASWLGATGLAGAAAGVIGALALRDPDPAERDVSELAELAAELTALRDDLEAERVAALALADEVAQLRAELEGRGAAADPGGDAVAAAPEAAPARGAAPAADSADWFDAHGLFELGASAQEVERLRELYEQNQLEILYLRDQATREGWAKTPRFRNERNQIQAALREELDDAAYDRLLYATGRPNRVLLDGVFADSPAARAGLEAGDAILRYGERAIFDPRELQQATAEGRAGTTVSIDVERDGALRRFYVPRGPLGARLRSDRRPPEARW